MKLLHFSFIFIHNNCCAFHYNFFSFFKIKWYYCSHESLSLKKKNYLIFFFFYVLVIRNFCYGCVVSGYILGLKKLDNVRGFPIKKNTIFSFFGISNFCYGCVLIGYILVLSGYLLGLKKKILICVNLHERIILITHLGFL